MRKDFLREIKKSWNRFLSILVIVALGVAFFAGIRSASPDMKLSADRYYDKENMMDLRVLGTWGLNEDDIEGLEKIEGIEEIEPVYSYDVMGQVNDNQYVLKAYSETETINKMKLLDGRMPEKEGECVIDSLLLRNEEFQIGKTLTVQSGTEEDIHDVLKNTEYKIVGVVSSAMYMDVERGSTTIGNGKIDGYFVIPKEEFTLGVYTEAYMTVTGAKEQVAYSKEYDACVEPVKKQVEDYVKTREELRYDDTIKEAKEKIQEGEQEVKDGQQELLDGKEEVKKAEQELLDGKQELEDRKQEVTEAKAQLLDGEEQIKKGEESLLTAKQQLEQQKEQLLDGKEQLEKAKKQLKEGEKEISKGKEQIKEGEEEVKKSETQLKEGQKEYEQNKQKAELALEQAKQELDSAKEKLDQGMKAYEEQENSALAPVIKAKEQLTVKKEQLAELEEQIKALEQTESNHEQLEALKKQYEAQQKEIQSGEQVIAQQETAIKEQLAAAKAPLLEAQAKYETGLAEYNEQSKTTKEQLKKAKTELLSGQQKIEEVKQQLLTSKETIEKKEEQLKKAKAELTSKEKELKEGEEELTAGENTIRENEETLKISKQEIETNRQKLLDAETELEKGEQQLKDGEQEIKDAKQELKKGEKELEDAKIELADAKDELADLEVPEYYAFDRGAIISAVSFGNDADRIKAIGQVFPAIFFLVAALVSLTTMTRMVESDRTQIGTLKALGYGKFSIAMKYLLYAFFASLIGSLIGMVAGQKILPSIIMNAYKMMYQTLPETYSPLNAYYSITSCLVAIITILIATSFACMKELHEVPAGLMRPVAPKIGKRVVLERISFLWNRLNFTTKVTIRNLFRYKKRFFMTVFGIGGCMALIIVGFGLQDSIFSIVNKQYGEIIKYDMAVSIKEGKKTEKVLEGQSQIADSLNTHQVSVDVGTQNEGKIYEGYVIIPEDKERFGDYIQLQNRKSKETYELSDQGVILSEKLQRLLGLEIGDEITIKQEGKEQKTVVVEGFTENYLYHYIYMSPQLYESLYGAKPDWNQILLKTEQVSEEQRNTLAEHLLKQSGVNSITQIAESKSSVNRMLEGMDIIIVVLVVSAGALAFVVLYNLNNINISERKRELATIKVLGFYDVETAEYVYRENVILTIIGIGVGVFLGIFLHRYVVVTAELDMMMLGREVKPLSFVYAGLLTIGFSMFVNFVLYFKLKKIDMVESLKSVE